MELILVRHGQSTANLEKRLSAHRNDLLTSLGEEQAKLAGARLAGLRPVDALYCSPLSRAVETARIIGEFLDLDPQPEDDLLELDLGALDGLTGQEARERYPQLSAGWTEDDEGFAFPGAESLLVSCRRAASAIDRLASQDGLNRITVVTHAGVIGVYLSWLLDGKLALSRIRLHNCSLTRLLLTTGAPQILWYDDITHLSPLIPPRQA